MEFWKIVISGLLGAITVTLGHIVSNYFTNKRHAAELQLRRRAETLSFLTPLATRRIESLEMAHDLLQKAIEEKSLQIDDYLALRKSLVYLPSDLRQGVLNSLRSLIKTVESDTPQSVVEEMKQIQKAIEDTLGISHIDQAIKELEEE